MYNLRIRGSFSAAHQLSGYQGKCESLHGHNWNVELNVSGADLDAIGLLIDFKELKKILGGILEEFDHKLINTLDAFREINPSSENLAKYIFNRVKAKLPGKVKVESVSVWESDTAGAEYTEC